MLRTTVAHIHPIAGGPALDHPHVRAFGGGGRLPIAAPYAP